jgi:hypothetical protein
VAFASKATPPTAIKAAVSDNTISLVRMSASFWMLSIEKCSSIIREKSGNSHGFERGAFLFSRTNKAFEADKKPQENFVIAMARAGPHCPTSICNINVEAETCCSF